MTPMEHLDEAARLEKTARDSRALGMGTGEHCDAQARQHRDMAGEILVASIRGQVAHQAPRSSRDA
jgi:hypothetical protein